MRVPDYLGLRPLSSRPDSTPSAWRELLALGSSAGPRLVQLLELAPPHPVAQRLTTCEVQLFEGSLGLRLLIQPEEGGLLCVEPPRESDERAPRFSPRAMRLVERLGLLGCPAGGSWLDPLTSALIVADLPEGGDDLSNFVPFFDLDGELEGWRDGDWARIYTRDHETGSLTLVTRGGLDGWFAARLGPAP